MRLCKPSAPWLLANVIFLVLMTLSRVAILETYLYSNNTTNHPTLDMNRLAVELPGEVSRGPASDSDATNNIKVDTNTNDNTNDTITELSQGFRIHAEWHPRLRSERFPSVKERVMIYMSNWYHPPCGNSSKLSKFMDMKPLSFDSDAIACPHLELKHPWDVDSSSRETYHTLISPGDKFLMNRYVIEDCARTNKEYLAEGKRPSESQIDRRYYMQGYCADSVELLDLMDQFDDHANNLSTPLLASFGDTPGILKSDLFDVPFVAKFRAATTRQNLEAVIGDVPPTEPLRCNSRPPSLVTEYHQNIYKNRASPILWKLVSERHWKPLKEAASSDIPWEDKKNLAIWRGAMTGRIKKKSSIDAIMCRAFPRCSFVLQHANSSLIDCGLTKQNYKLQSEIMNGTRMIKSKVDIRGMQEYKVIISMEGNDVSTGLKWNLQSSSVVLMPPPTRTSWAMEELLQPWVHYVPMLPDGSNAEAMVQWVLDNDTEARRIAERATLFMYDFLYHPDAKEDERKVKEEIVRRYRALWY